MAGHINSKLLLLYADGLAPGKTIALIESHLAACPSCKAQLQSLRKIKKILSKTPKIEMSQLSDIEFKRWLRDQPVRQGFAVVFKQAAQDFAGDLRVLVAGPSHLLVRAGALATIMAFLTVSICWNQIAAAPAIASIQGEASIFNSKNGRWQAARPGERLARGDTIKVGKNSQLNIESKRYAALLKEDTEVKAISVEAPFRTKTISYEVEKGKMLVATNKRFKGSELTISSPVARVKAVGTGFMVNVMPAQNNKTWVGVCDGTVEFNSRLKLAGLSPRVIVDAGKASEALGSSGPLTPRYLLEDEWKEVQEIYRLAEQPQVALLVSMTPRRVHELLRPAGLYISDKSTRTMPREMAQIIGQISEAMDRHDRQGHLGAARRLEQLIEKHPSAKYNVQFLFFIAGYYYYLDEYKTAVLVLDRIISEYPNSALKSLAVCAKGLIYEENLKDRPAAVRSYKTILSAYPNSLEAPEALAGLARVSAK